MSEFKFACPVCGQHITADVSAGGSLLDCPTCFRKIIVPHAPASGESKILLAAAEAGSRRGVSAPTPSSETRAPVRQKKFRIAGIAVVALLLAMVVWMVLTGRLPGGGRAGSQGADGGPLQVATVAWKGDLSQVEIPAETVFGRIRGSNFVCDRAVLQGGTLNLRMGKLWPPELGLSVHLFSRNPEELSGKSALITTNNIRSPRVVVRWKDATGAQSEVFTNHFAMKLEFGVLDGNRLPGKIYLCLPDPDRTRVAGVFNAEVRRPASNQTK